MDAVLLVMAADTRCNDSEHSEHSVSADPDDKSPSDDSRASSPSQPHPDPALELSSDIFDQSLRFSHVHRPSFHIDTSSPVEQLRGDFISEEERIANLFKRTSSATSSKTVA